MMVNHKRNQLVGPAVTSLLAGMVMLSAVTVVSALSERHRIDTGAWSSLTLEEVRAIALRVQREQQRAEAIGRVRGISVLALYDTQRSAYPGRGRRAALSAKAMLHIDGKRHLLAPGETSPEGVTLVSAGSDIAVVEVNGYQEVLTLGATAVYPGTLERPVNEDAGDDSVSLWAGPGGFFYADGTINGYPVHFLIDTGANTVAISGDLARRIGLDHAGLKQELATTAGGLSPVVPITLDRVSVGDITLNDVAAGIMPGQHPETPLLGLSFLGKLDMSRIGDEMHLKRRH